MNDQWTNPSSLKGKRLDFGHLGGTSTSGDPDSWYPELWTWLIRTNRLGSVLDVGCGVGYSQKFFHDSGLITLGVDCKQVLEHHVLGEKTLVHDFTTGVAPLPGRFDLVWCCEVAEHIPEEFVSNLAYTFAMGCGKLLAFCAAPRGAGGYHHVNCQNPPYWISLLSKYGFTINEEMSEHGRRLCGPHYGRGKNNYFYRSGLIFTKD